MIGRIRCLLGTVGALSLLAACSTGTTISPGTRHTPAPTATPSPTSTPSSSQAVTSSLISGQPIQLPPVGGFSGTVTYTAVGASSFPAGTTVTLQSFLTRPPGAPAPQGSRRRPLDEAPTGYGYVNATFGSSFGPGTEPLNQSYNVSLPGPALSSYTANVYDDANGTLVTVGAPGVYGSDGSVTFPQSTTLSASTGTTYTTEFVANSQLTPAPTASGSTPTPSPTPTATVPGATPTPTPAAGAQSLYWTPFHDQPMYQLAFAPLPLTANSSDTEIAGTANNNLRCTSDMAVDPVGRLWILSTPGGCSQQFATTIAEVFTLPITASSKPIYSFELTGVGDINHLVFDKSGNLWVSDEYNKAIYEYTSFTSDQTMTPALTLHNGITSPGGVAVDAAGNVYVTLNGSTGTNSIAVFRPPLTNATTPTYMNGLTTPAGLAFDSAGNLYASSNPAGSAGSIARYNSTNLGDGATPDVIDSTGGTTADYGADFAFDAPGNLYDADCGGHGRIMVFPTATTPFSPSLAPSVTYTKSITAICFWGLVIR